MATLRIDRQVDRLVDRLLASPSPAISPGRAVALATVLSLLYGVVMGTFSGVWDGRTLQLFYSAVKVPLLLLVTGGIALPSFFVLNVLAGAASDFREVMRAQVAAQAGMSVVLISMAPLTFFWYASSNGYASAILVNAACFGVASLSGQALLRRYYRPLEARRPVHRLLRRTWIFIYAFVGIQMVWVLRPFIGQPGSAEQFFREGAWGNAYVEVLKKVAEVFGG